MEVGSQMGLRDFQATFNSGKIGVDADGSKVVGDQSGEVKIAKIDSNTSISEIEKHLHDAKSKGLELYVESRDGTVYKITDVVNGEVKVKKASGDVNVKKDDRLVADDGNDYQQHDDTGGVTVKNAANKQVRWDLIVQKLSKEDKARYEKHVKEGGDRKEFFKFSTNGTDKYVKPRTDKDIQDRKLEQIHLSKGYDIKFGGSEKVKDSRSMEAVPDKGLYGALKRLNSGGGVGWGGFPHNDNEEIHQNADMKEGKIKAVDKKKVDIAKNGSASIDEEIQFTKDSLDELVKSGKLSKEDAQVIKDYLDTFGKYAKQHLDDWTGGAKGGKFKISFYTVGGGSPTISMKYGTAEKADTASGPGTGDEKIRSRMLEMTFYKSGTDLSATVEYKTARSGRAYYAFSGNGLDSDNFNTSEKQPAGTVMIGNPDLDTHVTYWANLDTDPQWGFASREDTSVIAKGKE